MSGDPGGGSALPPASPPPVAPADKTLYVTRPDLPPLDELLPALQAIWHSHQLTNNGPFHQRLEAELCRFLDVPALSLFCNGTIALLAAIQSLGLQGEVITTPYSFVATTHALRWAGLTPVFADIEPDTFTLDPQRLEAALTPRTSAILPVHVYGHPCDHAAIQAFADAHGLKVLYDSAHAFGVRGGTGPDGHALRQANLLRQGDLAVLSFHATKVFNTFEGGAVVSASRDAKLQIDRLKNFGFVNEVTVDALGINGKMNELQAAVGCLQLPRFDALNARRAAADVCYRQLLAGVPGLQLPPQPTVAVHNHGYFPLQVTPAFGCSRDALYQRLREAGILARRYFYPLISDFPMYTAMPGAAPDNLPVARRVAQQVLCLPLYAELDEADCRRVVQVILNAAAG